MHRALVAIIVYGSFRGGGGSTAGGKPMVPPSPPSPQIKHSYNAIIGMFGDWEYILQNVGFLSAVSASRNQLFCIQTQQLQLPRLNMETFLFNSSATAALNYCV